MSLLLGFLLLGTGQFLYGQQIKANGWQFSSASLKLQGQADVYTSLKLPVMLGQMTNPEMGNFGLTGTEQKSFYSPSIQGPVFSLNLAFNPTRNGVLQTQREIRFGLQYAPEREGMVTYETETDLGQTTQVSEYTYCLMQDELGASVDYLFHTRRVLGFSAFVGVGTSTGVTLMNDMLLMTHTGFRNNGSWSMDEVESTQEVLDARTNIFQRVYMPVGVRARILGFTLYLEGQVGSGLAYAVGDRINPIAVSASFGGGIGWSF